MHDPRHPQRAPHDRQSIVPVAHRDIAPGAKVVSLTSLVHGHGRPTVEEHESAARCGELHGLKVSVEDQHSRAKDIRQLAPRAKWKMKRAVPKDGGALRLGSTIYLSMAIYALRPPRSRATLGLRGRSEGH